MVKIRDGFVSNSSSSSFIVALPSRKDVEAKLKKLTSNHVELENQLKKLYDGSTDPANVLWAEECKDWEVFDLLNQWFNDNDLVLGEVDGSSEERRIIGISLEALKEKIVGLKP